MTEKLWRAKQRTRQRRKMVIKREGYIYDNEEV